MQRAGFLLGRQTGRPARQFVLLRPQGSPIGPALRTALGKETLQQLAALVGQQPPLHDRLVVEPPLGRQIQHPAAHAGLGVRGAEHHPADTGVQHRAQAHHARLQRHIERGFAHPIVAQLLGRHPQGADLGMRRRIMTADGMVVAGGDHLPRLHQHGAHRHLTMQLRIQRLIHRQAHHCMIKLAERRLRRGQRSLVRLVHHAPPAACTQPALSSRSQGRVLATMSSASRATCRCMPATSASTSSAFTCS